MGRIEQDQQSLEGMPDRESPKIRTGESLALAASALTKSLRAGNEIEALYWALRLEERFPKYLLRRLAVFAAEDIGLADPLAVVVVGSIATAYRADLDESRAHRPDGALVAMVVQYLARSPKSREVDDFKETVRHGMEEGWEGPVWPRFMDLHTAEGREQMPDKHDRLRHWLGEASALENDNGPKDYALAIRRWAVKIGALGRDAVEDQARRWDAEGRLVEGVRGVWRWK